MSPPPPETQGKRAASSSPDRDTPDAEETKKPRLGPGEFTAAADAPGSPTESAVSNESENSDSLEPHCKADHEIRKDGVAPPGYLSCECRWVDVAEHGCWGGRPTNFEYYRVVTTDPKNQNPRGSKCEVYGCGNKLVWAVAEKEEETNTVYAVKSTKVTDFDRAGEVIKVNAEFDGPADACPCESEGCGALICRKCVQKNPKIFEKHVVLDWRKVYV